MDVKISVVVTLYHSEKYVREFYSRIQKSILSITPNYEIVFVSDGSPDRADLVVLELQQQDSKIILVELSRNFGHHQAIMTGLGQATGDYIFLIDVDLEEDPALIVDFWQAMKMNSEVDVVFGVQERRKGNFLERVSGNLFYKTLNLIAKIEYPANTFTARLMKKRYVDSVLNFKEKAMDIWAIFALAGFNQKPYPASKKSKGSSTYTFFKKLAMSVEIITSFSNRPLYIIFVIGCFWLMISFTNVVIILIKKWVYGTPIEGWASIMASVWLIGGIIIFLIGIIGIYLSKMFLEIKDRPMTIIKKIYSKE
jgi:putative glycosyltransferase